MMLFAIILFFMLSSSDVVATIGDRKITVTDFVERYKKFLESSGTKDNLVVRNNILQVMVYEDLILQDALRKKLYSDEAYRRKVEKIQIQSILASYYDLLADTMTVSEYEMRESFMRMNTKLHARHLYAPTLSAAQQLRKRLNKGESFSALALEVFGDSRLKYSGGDLGFFNGGDMDPAFEKAAFSLPVGAISDPIKTEDGFSIIKVEQRVTRPMITEMEFAAKKSKMEILVKTGKRSEMASSCAKSVVNDIHPIFYDHTLKKLFTFWKKFNTPESFQASEQLESIEGLSLVTSNDGTWKVRDFRMRLFKITGRHFFRIHSMDDLRELITGLLVQEELVRRSRSLGLDTAATYRKRVANDTIVELIRSWSDDVYKTNIQFDQNSNTFIDPNVRRRFENTIAHRYQKFAPSYVFSEERSIAEIVVDSFQTAMALVRMLGRGSSFETLAKKYSHAPSSVSGGLLGYGPRAMFGHFSDTLFASQKNVIIGPIQIDDKFILFKVIDIRPSRQKSFSNARSEIAEKIISEWKTEAYRTEVNSMLSRTSYYIDKEVLASISL